MKKFNRIFKRILKKIKNILIKDQYELLEKTLYDIVKRNLNLLQKPQFVLSIFLFLSSTFSSS